MPGSSAEDVTTLLVAWRKGDRASFDKLQPLVYDELRRIAKLQLGKESRRDHTLEPTALVHEAYLRLVDQQSLQWQDRAHFFALAATTMRRILVDHARGRGTAKRDPGRPLLPLTAAGEVAGDLRTPDLVALDDCLTALAETDPLKASIVEMRFFGGLSLDETAEVVGCSRATVVRQWRMAKAWLYHEIHGDAPGET